MAWLSDKEVELLLETGASAIHCPSASMKGAYGAFTHGRFPELLAAGGTVGLGTDGPAAACFLDMFREVHLAATGHKEARSDWTLISPYEALELATIGMRDEGTLRALRAVAATCIAENKTPGEATALLAAAKVAAEDATAVSGAHGSGPAVRGANAIDWRGIFAAREAAITEANAKRRQPLAVGAA